MKSTPTIHDIHIMLVEIRGDLKSLLKEQDEVRKRQDAHEVHDKERFETIQEKIDGLRHYAVSVSVIAGAIGFAVKYVWDAIRG